MRGHRWLQAGMVSAAGWLVPRAGRAEWLQEWRAEVWHARQQMPNEAELTRVCLGVWQDALCVRRMAQERGGAEAIVRRAAPGSAARCVLGLAALLAVSFGLARMLPGVRAQSLAAQYTMNPGLILIEDGSAGDDAVATIPAETYRAWKAGQQRFFDGLAFYRMGHERVAGGEWQVAHASENLFWLLGLPVRMMSGDGDTPGVVLSDAVWKREFGADADIAGSVVHMGGREVRVLGVAAEGAWRLPGDPDAWLLEPDAESKGAGFVVAHLNERGREAMHGSEVAIAPADDDDGTGGLRGVSLGERMRGPMGLYWFAIFLAFLALPAITSVSLGEYNFSERRPEWTSTARRWALMAAKIALLLPAVHFAAMDVAYWKTATYSHPSGVCATACDVFDVPVWIAVGAQRSARAVSGVFAAGDESRARGPGGQNLSRMERHGDDLRKRPHAAACAVAADELVQHAAMDVPGYVVEVFV